MKVIKKILAVTGIVALLSGVCASTASADSVQTATKSHPHELTVSYYRAWRDMNSDPGSNENMMSDLPPQVDIAVAFPNDEVTQAYWDTLPQQISDLHGQGTKVIRSLDIRVFYKNTFDDAQEKAALTAMPSTQEGYARRAEQIRTGLLDYAGLDGLVINAEASMSSTDIQRAIGTIRQLARYYGPHSGTGKILAFNTNKPGTNSLFMGVYDLVSYVFADAYGRSVSQLQSDWSSYRGLIDSSQYIPGFSFYEENGMDWGDTREPIETSRAMQYAKWEPDAESGQFKGGLFGYAVDRDGVPAGVNWIQYTTFEWTKALAKAMNPEEYA